MEFRLLGPVEVRDDRDQPLRLGGQKPRTLLAVLRSTRAASSAPVA